MNIDQDYDNDGNNIVPCPICLDVHCKGNNGGKCPKEDEFTANWCPVCGEGAEECECTSQDYMLDNLRT